MEFINRAKRTGIEGEILFRLEKPMIGRTLQGIPKLNYRIQPMARHARFV